MGFFPLKYFKRKCVWGFFFQTVLSWLGKNKQHLPPDFYTCLSRLMVYLLLFFLRPKESKNRGVGEEEKRYRRDHGRREHPVKTLTLRWGEKEANKKQNA